MDRKTIIGFVLLGVLFIGFFLVQSHFSQVDQAKQAAQQDSLRRVQQLKIQDSLVKVKEQQINAAKNNQDSVLQVLNMNAGEKRTQDSVNLAKSKTIFGPFQSALSGSRQAYILENDKLKIEFSNLGGKINTVQLKQFKNFYGGPLELVKGNENKFGYTFYFDNDKVIKTDSLYFEPIQSTDGKSITFRLDAGNGKFFDQIYALNDTDYLVDYTVSLKGFDEIIPKQISMLILNWQNTMQEQEKNLKYEKQYSKFYFSYANGDVDYKSANGRIDFDSKVNWVSCQQQFFNTTLIAKNNFDSQGFLNIYSTDTSQFVKQCLTQLYIPFNNQNSFDFPMQFYFAPNHFKSLKELGIGLETIVPTGTGLSKIINRWAIIPIFNWLGSFIFNYGIIIFIMIIIIKLVLTPLTYRSYLSMAKMRVLQPEITELREKYKEDQAKFGQEQLKLFRKAGVSPLGGCIPSLLSWPILVSMFRFFPGSIELRQKSFLWAQDLSTYDDLIRWNGNIPFLGNHISLFCVLMTISSIFYIRLNMTNTASITKEMKFMQYIFPFVFFFILNNSPAALSYYYFASNMVTFGQQFLIQKYMIDEKAVHRKIQENKAKPQKKSGFQKRLEDAMKQQQAVKKSKKK